VLVQVNSKQRLQEPYSILGSSVQFFLPNFSCDDVIDDVIDWSWCWQKVTHQIWWWRHYHLMRYSLSKLTACTYLRAFISACLYGVLEMAWASSFLLQPGPPRDNMKLPDLARLCQTTTYLLFSGLDRPVIQSRQYLFCLQDGGKIVKMAKK